MELRQLEYFVAVAEEANFTRAAARVHISQSGVSAQIKALEHELGIELIDRSGRRAALTAAGSVALEHARATLAAADAVKQAADDAANLIRGSLVVGMVVASTFGPLFDALASFHLAHPGVEITLVEDNSDKLIERIRDGAMDLALIGVASATPPDLATRVIISERLVAAVPAGHPLGKRKRVSLAEISGYPIVCLPPGTGVRDVLDRACAERGLTPDIALQASAPAAVADLAARGLGIAVLSRSTAASHAPGLNVLQLDIDTPTILALAWCRSVSPALRELLAHYPPTSVNDEP